jgi:hypothetical protein
MMHNAALQGAYETPRRFRISTSLLLTAAVAVLCAAVLAFASFNRPPSEDLPYAVAPLNQDQEAGTPTPTLFEPTATMIPVEGQVTMPPTIPATGEPSSVTDVPDSGFTATPMPFNGSIEGVSATATPVPFVTSTALPFSVNLYVPTYVPFAGDHVAPPSVWFFGDGHISAPDSSGLMIQLPNDRVEGTSGETPLTAGQFVNLYTTIAIPDENAPAAAVQRDPINPSEAVVALVPIAASVEVMSVSEGGAIVRVSVEQGIVLNWLLNDTPARIYYGRAE